MKRAILLMVIFSLLLGLSACSLGTNANSDHVTFYYCRGEYSYGTNSDVMGSEQRYVSTHGEDLSYLIPLYLVGPVDEELTALFPGQTQLLSLTTQDGKILIALSDNAEELDDARFTLACACLTMTCLEITDQEAVEITCGERTVTMSRENLLLQDTIFPEPTTTEETQ